MNKKSFEQQSYRMWVMKVSNKSHSQENKTVNLIVSNNIDHVPT
jgi:hypothetical protein